MKRFTAILSTAILMAGLGLATANEPAKDAPAKSAAINSQGLSAMLDGMGLTPKEGKYTNGNPYYDIKMLHDGWDCHVRLALSPNGRALWLHLNVATLPPVDEIPAAKLIELLRKNASGTGKAQFCVRGNNLMLLQPVDNHHLTPARLLIELQDLCTAAKSLEPDYNPKHWTAPVKSDAAQK